MGMGKGGTTTQTIELPESLERAAQENLALADQVGRLGFMPYQGPTVAGLSTGQEAAMGSTNAAANAFGLPQMAAPQFMGDVFTGPDGRIAGYGGATIGREAFDQLPAGQREAVEGFMIDPITGAPARTPLPEVKLSRRGSGGKK